MNDPGASYDELPYPSSARKYTHPIYLCSAAAMAGFSAPSPSHCRVLEIGCSDAGNMLNMALTLPDAEFVGIDLSAREIEAGRSAVQSLGLDNIRLEVMNIMDVDGTLGAFDYIIAHGIFSWVPPFVRRKVLEVCRDMLAPNGVAFISYNTYPGCRLREAVRDLARFGSRNAPTPEAAVAAARQTLETAVRLNASEHEYYTKLLAREREMLASVADSFVAHDVLETDNRAYYFREFAEEIKGYELEHFSDSTIDAYRILYPPEPLGQMFSRFGNDLYKREQQLDLYVGRQFRESLVCHAGVSRRAALIPDGVASGKMFIASRLNTDPEASGGANVLTFTAKSGSPFITSDVLMQTALIELQNALPDALTTEELCLRIGNKMHAEITSGEVLLALMECYRMLTDSIEFWTEKFPAATEAGEFPVASPVAQFQARNQMRITALNHEAVELNPIQMLLLVAMDGARSREELTAYLIELFDSGELEIGGAEDAPREAITEFLAMVTEQFLDFFVRNALVVDR